MEWDRGTKFSAALHGGVIIWAIFGDWLFAPSDMPEMQVAEVSMVSEDEFKALMDAAPKPDKPSPEEPAPQVEPPKPVELEQPEPAPAPEPEPAPEPLPETLPVDANPQPIEAPEPVAPIAEEEQPIPVPETSTKPKPRPSERIAAVPVDEATDSQEIAETVTPETSDQAQPDAPVVEQEQTEASPQEASTQIVTEATETDEEAPQLAPTSSRRPQSRLEKPVELAEEPPEDTAIADALAEAAAEEPPAEDTAAEQDAIAAALAEASETPEDTGGAESDLPEGPKMSASDIEGFRLAIKQCWNVGALSTDALNTRVRMRFRMNEDGKPDPGSFEITGYEGGTEVGAQKVYETGRRAIIRCAGPGGYDLPPEKYQDWSVVNVEFDPNGMRLR
jgi:hypothetical protein